MCAATKTCGFVPVQGASERNNHPFQVREIWNSRQRCLIWRDIAWLCGVSYYTKIGVHITDSGARANCAGDHPIGNIVLKECAFRFRVKGIKFRNIVFFILGAVRKPTRFSETPPDSVKNPPASVNNPPESVKIPLEAVKNQPKSVKNLPEPDHIAAANHHSASE